MAERVDAVFEALIEHVANHDYTTLRPLTHASEIRVIELHLRSVAELECAEQGRHGIAADPMATSQVIDNLAPFGTTVWRWREYFVEAGVEGLVKGRSATRSTLPSPTTPMPTGTESWPGRTA